MKTCIKDFIDDFIRRFGEDQKYKDHIFLAGDTTVIKVPNVSKCKEEFPVVEDTCTCKIINIC